MEEDEKIKEDRRLLIAGVIVASFLAMRAIGDISFWSIALPTLGISALLSTVYLIMTAATLKHSDPGRLYQIIVVNDKTRQKMYDWSIDVFGFTALMITGMLTLSLANGGFYSFMAENHPLWLFTLVVAAGTVICFILRSLAWLIGEKLAFNASKTRLSDVQEKSPQPITRKKKGL